MAAANAAVAANKVDVMAAYDNNDSATASAAFRNAGGVSELPAGAVPALTPALSSVDPNAKLDAKGNPLPDYDMPVEEFIQPVTGWVDYDKLHEEKRLTKE